MNREPDRCAGIATVLAVILAGEYSEVKYDGWDVALGAMGLVFAVSYLVSLDKKDWFKALLAGSLFGISLVTVSYTVLTNIEISATVSNKLSGNYWIFDVKLGLVVIVAAFAAGAGLLWASLRQERPPSDVPPQH